MRFSLILILFCMTLHTMTHSKSLVNEDYLHELIAEAIEKNNTTLYAMFKQCTEKAAYTGIGTIAALCGCYLTTTGLKRTFCDKDKVKSGLALTSTGLVLLFVGLNIATIDIT